MKYEGSGGKWLRWAADHGLEFLTKNWKALLALTLAAGVGIAGTRIVEQKHVCEPTPCPPCWEFNDTKEACIVRIDRCLDWMTDMP